MHARAALLLDSLHSERAVIPPGDPGEQLIANLLLSSIAYQLDSVACARSYGERARSIAVGLGYESLTYRRPCPSKFLRVKCDLTGESETLLLSIIEGKLVLPTLRLARFAPDKAVMDRSATIVDFEIEQFRIRLRLRRLAAALESLDKMTSTEESALLVRRILTDSLHCRIAWTDPLERADDFFSMARDLVGMRNLPLAALSLERAQGALNMCTIESAEQAGTVRTLKEHIAQTIDELKRGYF